MSESPFETRFARFRRKAGLSQAELGRRAGVSRQTVGAIEAGRHRPGIDAALALAGALGEPVEAVFGSGRSDEPQAAEPVLGPASHGRPGDCAGARPARAARVGERVVYAPAVPGVDPGWPEVNAELQGNAVRAVAEDSLGRFVVVGCDPALGTAASIANRAGAGSIDTLAVHGSTGAALQALQAGRAHAAAVHAADTGHIAPAIAVMRVHVAGWRIGLAVPRLGVRSGVARDPAELCAGSEIVVQRESEASGQQSLESLLAGKGVPVPAGPRASGHLDAARQVAMGQPAGLTFEPAALSLGLDFVPIEEHSVELWIDARYAELEETTQFLSTLRSPLFRRQIELIGGYDLSGCGSIVATG